jgi:alkanesulfonate monooxygenase SsuD/methylene tetrahydromethanopterin reductase-like flavin-dependent oxidoreductase (luciferase family)
MQFGFVIPFGDPRLVLDLAVEIELAGWDAAFTWETIYFADPWVTLGAMAVRTERVKLGPLLTPPSRRRPWKLASEVATVDRLSSGRAILAVGLGALDTGFAEVGEETGRKERAELMDECLEVADRFWSGAPFSFEGRHYRVEWMQERGEPFRPVQQPRPPVWVVTQLGAERSMKRAFRWDGALPFKKTPDNPYAPLEPGDVARLRRLATEHNGDRVWDIALEGMTPVGDAAATDRVARLADAGATWWIESMWEHPGGVDAVRERIAAGPPDVGTSF